MKSLVLIVSVIIFSHQAVGKPQSQDPSSQQAPPQPGSQGQPQGQDTQPQSQVNPYQSPSGQSSSALPYQPSQQDPQNQRTKMTLNPLQRLIYAVFNINLGPIPVSRLVRTIFLLPIVYEIFYGPLAFLNPYVIQN